MRVSETFRKSLPSLCEDGVVRVARVLCNRYDGSFAADTWFSVPASIRVSGKYVRGYVSGRDRDGTEAPSLFPDVALEFRAMNSHKHLLSLTLGG